MLFIYGLPWQFVLRLEPFSCTALENLFSFPHDSALPLSFKPGARNGVREQGWKQLPELDSGDGPTSSDCLKSDSLPHLANLKCKTQAQSLWKERWAIKTVTQLGCHGSVVEHQLMSQEVIV